MIKTSYIGAEERVYPVYKLVPLTASLGASGVPVERALAGSGIAVAALADPYARISRRQVITVFENFLRLAAGNASALQIGSTFHLTDYGFFGYALLSSASVRDAAHFALDYQELATPIVDIELLEHGEDAVWDIRALPEIAADAALNRFVLEYQSGIIIALHKSVSGGAFRLSSASFAFAAPVNAAHYHHVLNCPIEFDAVRTELRFDRTWLEQRPSGANSITFRLVEDACQEMLQQIGQERGTVGTIYRHLLGQSGRFATLDEMAALLGLHPRTLRRKLTGEGATYQKIVDEVRFKLAATYLLRTPMSHESISERLGFSDASSFRRAFKRWADLAPNEFRNRQRAGDADAVTS